MIKQIKSVNNQDMTCLESILATVLCIFGKDYKLMWAESWGFSYQNDNRLSLGERINPNKRNIFESINKFYGLKITEINTLNANEIITAINLENNNSVPVAIYIDAYWCSWFPLYQKQHLERYCLALGSDEDFIYCLDPQFSQEIQLLEIKDFVKGYREYLTFSLSENKLDTYSTWKNSMINNLNQLLQDKSAFNMMREFAKEVTLLKDLSKEVSLYKDINSVHLFRRIVYISMARKNYSDILRFIYNEYRMPFLKQYSDEMLEVSKKWKIVERTFFKATFIKEKRNIFIQIAELIYEIANQEEKIAKELKIFLINN